MGVSTHISFAVGGIFTASSGHPHQALPWLQGLWAKWWQWQSVWVAVTFHGSQSIPKPELPDSHNRPMNRAHYR